MFRRKLIPVLLLLPLAACVQVQDTLFDTEAEAADIRQVMMDQVAAWNAGSIEAFMQGYHKGSDLRFISGARRSMGWQSTLDGYLRTYPDRATMGTLTFENLEINVYPPDAAMVFGGWRLQRAEDEPHGLFTLIFQKEETGWKIIHDHTSSAEE